MDHVDDIKLLCEGVSAWNRYRRDNPRNMDLSHIEIRNADLRGVDFSNTDMDGSRWQNINVTGSDFHNAGMNGITATGVDFRSAGLNEAEFKGTDFSNCCFDEAEITEAKCYQLKVRHSSFRKSLLQATQFEHVHFYNSDLSECECKLSGCMQVNFKRVVMNEQLQGYLLAEGITCDLTGLPNEQDWTDWSQERIQLGGTEFGVVIFAHQAYWINEGRWDIFISHATAQKADFVKPLTDRLQDDGLRVWYDANEINVSDSLTKRINFGLKSCPFGLLVLSKEYVVSEWTQYELERLLDKRLIIVLHDISPDEIKLRYPQLADKLMLPSVVGVESIAQQIVNAIRRPPHQLVAY
jgi:uncharacterized protein YjbI with pentapeptide repeats